MKKLIAKLESITEKGQGNVCIAAMVRSKKKELKRRLCGTPPSTPPDSEDEDDDGLDDYSIEPTYSENMLDSSYVEQETSLSNKSVLKLENVNKVTLDNLHTKTLVNRSGNNNMMDFDMIESHHHVHFDRSYMHNDDFWSTNYYGGGKRKSKDSDGDYDPENEKKNAEEKKEKI